MLRVETETGRTYLIDDGYWRRLPKIEGEYTGGWEKVWSLQHGTHFAFPWNSPEDTWQDGNPVIGEYMFISSRDVWWTSTKVIKITEEESEFS